MGRAGNGLGFLVIALTAGLFASGAAAEGPLGIQDTAVLGKAVSAKALDRERGGDDVAVAVANQNAEQKVVNVIKSDGPLTSYTGTLDSNVVSGNMSIGVFNSGNNTSWTNQIQIDVSIVNSP